MSWPFFFKQKTAYEIGVRLVGSEMCIRDSIDADLDLLWDPLSEYTDIMTQLLDDACRTAG